MKKIKESVLAHIYGDPISEKTNKNKRNAIVISGLSILHFWNPIELTGLGFKLNSGSASSVSIILLVLLSYLSFTLILNIVGDILESNEKINDLDLKETQGNWSILYEWAKSLNGKEGDGPYRDPSLDSTKANIKALTEKIPEVLALEAKYRDSVKKARIARVTRTLIVDIFLPFLIIICAFNSILTNPLVTIT
ncbi:MAG: hypothetical protein EOO07_38805, partial [Chitinophagaceae bacterium]